MSKAKSLFDGFLSFAKFSLKLTFVTALVASLCYLTTIAPELHNRYLRDHVGSKVYKIQDNPSVHSGGTGFAIKAKSGKTYIVSNDHVCEGSTDDEIYVVDQMGRAMARKIIERSTYTDLCLIEGVPDVEGLSLSEEPSLGESLYVVGHPQLRPLSVDQGEMVGYEDVEILDYQMKPEDPRKCDLPKNKIVQIDILKLIFGIPGTPVDFCLTITKQAFMTTITIYPGNSGSPVVDRYGKVVGAAFAADGTNWALVVSLSDLEKFLSER